MPVDVRANLLWRREVVRRGFEDEGFAGDVRAWVAEDLVAFVSGFCWTFDPRKRPNRVPFVLYPFQREGLQVVDRAVGSHDLVVAKTRDMGASWVVLAAFLWRWLHREGENFLCASRVASYVDEAGNPKCLFWKLDYLLEGLPSWMQPGRGKGWDRAAMRLVNLENGSVVNGESTTSNLGRGDRRTAVLIDEFAAYELQDGYDVLSSTRDVTRSRIFVSTLGVAPGAFEALAQNRDFARFDMPWWRHPEKAEGMYKAAGGKLRSPWYDAEVRRCATPQEVARELDIDFSAAQGGFFNPLDLNRAMAMCRSPLRVGELDFDKEGRPLGWRDDPKGRFRLWMMPDARGSWPADRQYIAGGDVASGTGQSNSCLQVVDASCGEQVMEFADPLLRPDQFAVLAVAVARWFSGRDGGGALLVHENAGPGLTFTSVAYELGYRRFWLKRQQDSIGRPMTEQIGMHSNKQEKMRTMGLLRTLVAESRLAVRSREAVEEMRQFVYTQDGSVEHSGARRGGDPSGARKNHGDRASALAMAAVAMFDGSRWWGRAPERAAVPVAMPGSIAWRRMEREEEARNADEDAA